MYKLHKMLTSKAGLKCVGRIFSPRKLVGKNNRKLSNNKPAVILGIETSCDDTGCAVVDSNGAILGEALHSQQSVHLDNGGIIPPLAQELHRQKITKVVEKALLSANLRLTNVDAIAATVKPGLVMSLLIGTNFGKYLSRVGNKPFIPIHHMEAHALTARMVENIDYPFLVLLISGGHCLLAIAQSVDKFYLLGSTIDDAPGEAFDKTARRLKLRNIPEFSELSGGAAVELAASRATDPEQFKFEVPMVHWEDCNFSSSGLKNAILKHTLREEKKHGIIGDELVPDIYNLCAGFQLAMTRHLCHRTQRAMEFIELKNLIPEKNRTLVVSGGAACNNFIANCLETVSSQMGYRFVRPPPKLCTDNGIMIAWNGVERWLADRGVLRDSEEIENVQVVARTEFGEDWREKVANAHVRCQWVKLKLPYPKTRKS
ncbi:probable tRNA N6-adenosine threonylcarbamoyltransferase, mitochondrial [Neodiprion virginianus]|uniref:probable tRNA N6-adenosine threonylcarbamoyltransferase, mitochondrial n=1 Tax=Neodiprion virginianus TaxID=2961670 RepID=UPI001EE72E9E|nr:probable tRNA N6-adenosine threonylcarbamoyltransferase, mitochondrial [Neodiprion virginianus]